MFGEAKGNAELSGFKGKQTVEDRIFGQELQKEDDSV